jgi:hypothetical protein
LLALLSVDFVFTNVFLGLRLFLVSIFETTHNAFALDLLLQVSKLNVLDFVSVKVSLKETLHSLNFSGFLRV